MTIDFQWEWKGLVYDLDVGCGDEVGWNLSHAQATLPIACLLILLLNPLTNGPEKSYVQCRHTWTLDSRHINEFGYLRCLR